MHSKMPRFPKIGALLVLLMSAESCILVLAGIALLVIVSIGLYILVPLSQPSPPAATTVAAVSTSAPTLTATRALPSAQPPLETGTPTPSPTHTPLPLPSDTTTPIPTFTRTPTPTPSPLASDSAQPPFGTPTAIPTRRPKATPTETPAPATPTPPPYDFVVVHQRLRTNEENGGTSEGGSANGCGRGHEIYVWVIDKAGAPLDGVVIGDTYDNPRHISGEKGPGHAQYILYMNGYRLLVVEDNNAGRPVTSQVSEVMSGNDWEIPIPWLIQGHYCATEAECLARRAEPNKPGGSGLCWGHYSYEIIFQRTW
jgi:hypothetical protein